jgi:aspartate/methionine/tyrosine aminotransferase
MDKAVGFMSRMDQIQSPIVEVVGEWIRETPGTISLGQGVVHYGPPPAAIDAVRQALARPATHEYQPVAGLPELRERIRAKLLAENHIDVARGSRVMVTAGANMAFMHAVMATTAPGDEVILPVPFYFNHEMAIQMAGCRAVPVPTDDRYQLRVDAIAAAVTSRTRAVVTISPNNPSGAVLRERELRDVNALCRDRGLYHVADEAYEYFTYGAARHVSPGSFPDAAPHTISMYSMSKAYGCAGWRIGYMAYPAHLEAAMAKSQDTILICPAVASQLAAMAALDVGRAYCEPHVRELAEIREIVVSRLAALAPLVTVPAADGAFYVLLRVDAERGDGVPAEHGRGAGAPGVIKDRGDGVPAEHGRGAGAPGVIKDRGDGAPAERVRGAGAPGVKMPATTLAERLVREHKVAVIPGSAFGMTGGCYLRVAYGALQKQTVAEGIGRLADGLRTILG